MFKQLSDLNRVLTVQGPLMLDLLHDEIYKLRRHRQAEYGYCPTVDCFASVSTRELLRSAMFEWLRSKGFYVQPEAALPSCPFDYDLYTFPSSGTQFSVVEIPEEYGDDGQSLWLLDLGNMTAEFEVLEPNRHLVIVGFRGVGFKD